MFNVHEASELVHNTNGHSRSGVWSGAIWCGPTPDFLNHDTALTSEPVLRFLALEQKLPLIRRDIYLVERNLIGAARVDDFQPHEDLIDWRLQYHALTQEREEIEREMFYLRTENVKVRAFLDARGRTSRYQSDAAENADTLRQEREPEAGTGLKRGEYSLVVTCAADVEPEEVEWLWYPYLPKRKLALIGGDPGVGKTFIALSIATSLSLGRWPFVIAGKPSGTTPGNTVIFSTEDGMKDTLTPRLIAMGADLKRIFFVEGKNDWKGKFQRVLLDDKDLIARSIRQYQASFAFFDPFQAFLPGKTKISDMETVRPVLTILGDTAQDTDCSIALLGHLNKAKQENAGYKFIGSVDWYAGARSAMLAIKDPENKPDGRLFYQPKNSLGREAPGMTFSISEQNDPPFLWGKGAETDLETAMSGHSDDDGKSKTEAAEEFLRGELAEGEQPSEELLIKAMRMGISRGTVFKAKKNLRIKARKGGFNDGWYWLPPGNEAKRSAKDSVF